MPVQPVVDAPIHSLPRPRELVIHEHTDATVQSYGYGHSISSVDVQMFCSRTQHITCACSARCLAILDLLMKLLSPTQSEQTGWIRAVLCRADSCSFCSGVLTTSKALELACKACQSQSCLLNNPVFLEPQTVRGQALEQAIKAQ